MSPRPPSRSTAAAMVALVLSALPANSPAMDPDGKSFYMKFCAACHQADGAGIPDAFPPLAGNRFVLGNPADVASLLFTGRGGMPGFGTRLHDSEIAAILGFVRNSWGNHAAGITSDEVALLRKQLQAAKVDPNPQSTRH
jgi:cytochrome c6